MHFNQYYSTMGSARHCSHCQTSHEGPVGKRCTFAQQEQDTDETVTKELGAQASTSSLSTTTINKDQARIAASQVQTPNHISSNVTSTGASMDGQILILAELQKNSQRFGQLEEQTSKDRQVLSGLVKQFNTQTSNMSASDGSSETVQELSNRSVKPTSPNISALSSVSSVKKDSVAINQGGQQQGSVLTDPNEGPVSGVRSKITGMPIPHITSVQPVNEMYPMTHCNNTGMYISNSQGTIEAVNNHQMSSQHGVRTETNNTLLSQALQMPQFQPQAEGVITHQSLLKQGITCPRLPNQGAGGQFTGTADHISFPVSQAVAVQGGQLRGTGEGHSMGSGSQGQTQGTVSQGSAEGIIPSLQVLRNSSEINRKVNQRYQELEDSAQLEQGTLDVLLHSLSQRVQKSQKPKVKWPQDLAFVGTLRRL